MKSAYLPILNNFLFELSEKEETMTTKQGTRLQVLSYRRDAMTIRVFQREDGTWMRSIEFCDNGDGGAPVPVMTGTTAEDLQTTLEIFFS